VAAKGTVVLAVNGKRYEAAGVDPSTTLLEFLRTQTPVRGPKLGCGEGTYVHPGASSCARIICAQAISRIFFPLESYHLAFIERSLIPQTTALFSSILRRLVWPGNSSSCMNTLRFYGVDFPKKKTSGLMKKNKTRQFQEKFSANRKRQRVPRITHFWLRCDRDQTLFVELSSRRRGTHELKMSNRLLARSSHQNSVSVSLG
jgi:hypothetical protein